MIFDAIESGALVSVIAALVALEAVAIILLDRVFGIGPGIGRIVFNLAAGAFLMLALRAALMGHGPAWIALFLSAALIAHVGDLVTRWRES